MMLSIQLYQSVYELNKGEILFYIPEYVYEFFHFLFLFFIYHAGKTIVKKETKPRSLEIIWLIVGLGGTGIIVNALSNWISDVYVANYSSIFWYTLDKHIGIITSTYFFITLVFVYRQLILFRSTKLKQNAWWIIDFCIYLGFSFVFDKYIHLPNFLLIAYFFVSLSIVLYLSIHTEWVAYLNFKEKLLGIVFMTIVLIIQLSYIFLIDVKYETDYNFDLITNLHLDLIYVFTVLYTFFSILVLAFNLPTSSLYELRQLEREAIGEINQAILKSKFDPDDVYKILINYSMLCAKADFGWIQVFLKSEKKIIHVKNFYENLAYEVHPIIEKYWSYQIDKKTFFVGDTRRLSLFREKSLEMESFFATKICTKDNIYGDLILGWKHKNAFELELYSFLSIISEQSAIALETKELFQKSISLERYQEQLKIAKDFQDKVLPKIPDIQGFDIHAINQEADEVGGDYFEIYQDEKHIDIIIADVAGKGTTAAFYMAEFKGMLQILFPLQLSPLEFIQRLNVAVSQCLSPNLFITANFLRIHKPTLHCEFIRAGHTPILHLSNSNKNLQIYDYQPKGIGLGIIRKYISEKNFEVYNFSLQKNDVLLLFTDGIIEARAPNNQELGLETLKDWLAIFHTLSSTEINYSIFEQIMAFTNGKKIDDDYTIITLKIQ